MAITYQEMAGSPQEEDSRKGFRGTRTFLVDWDVRRAAVAAILGNAYTYGGTGPWTYPDVPGAAAVGVKAEPFTHDIETVSLADPTAAINSYASYAKLIVTYEVTELETEELPTDDATQGIEPEVGYLTYRMDFAGTNKVIPGMGLRWTSDDEPPSDANFAHFHRMTEIIHQITWHRVPEPPIAAIRGLINHVNDAEFFGIPTGCCLFDGATIEREYLLSEFFDRLKQMWAVTYTFRERRLFDGAGSFIAEAWQREYRTDPGSEGWQNIGDADGNPLYASGDLMTLFTIHPLVAAG